MITQIGKIHLDRDLQVEDNDPVLWQEPDELEEAKQYSLYEQKLRNIERDAARYGIDSNTAHTVHKAYPTMFKQMRAGKKLDTPTRHKNYDSNWKSEVEIGGTTGSVLGGLLGGTIGLARGKGALVPILSGAGVGGFLGTGLGMYSGAKKDRLEEEAHYNAAKKFYDLYNANGGKV